MTRAVLLLLALVFTSAQSYGQSSSGWLDGVDCTSISGWAYDSIRPNTPINVDIYDGTTLVATFPANIFRQDLLNLGIGDGVHGFSQALPLSLKDGRSHWIHVKFGGTSIRLNDGRDMPVTCGINDGYAYYYTDILTAVNPGLWDTVGTVSGPGLHVQAGDTLGGSLISKIPVQDGTSDYEVKATLTLAASGGNYTVFLRASTNAQLGSSPQGTFYAVELQNPQFSGTACTASLQLYKKFGAQVESLGLVADVPCRNGMSIRAVRRPDGLVVHLDDVFYAWVPDSGFPNPITTGKPGIGGRQMPAGNSISRVELGPLDRVGPPAVNASSIGSSLFPTRVDLQWQAVTDGVVGTQRYDCQHAGGALRTFRCCEYSEAVSANTTYSYTVHAIDFHLNYSLPTTITVKTPESGWIDGRRIGVRPEGSYWGGLGEQIDTRSGNLNFTKPLVKAQGRGGWGVAFALSYNSQNWRKDPGGTWKLGRDSGNGYGWRLMAGSLTPYYDSYLTPTFYLYTDATGAEYKLNSNAGGVWTSKEAVYASYDSNTGRLYFPDGSFWVFGCISAGTEEDGGTMYPTLMQDTNGAALS